GFDNRAKKRRTYVVYANGEVARTKNFLFFKSYPSVEPGAEIIVPSKSRKIPFMPGEIIGITTGLPTLALILTQIDFNQKASMADQTQIIDDTITLSELLARMASWVQDFNVKWIIMLAAMLVADILGLLASEIKKPVYTSETSF